MRNNPLNSESLLLLSSDLIQNLVAKNAPPKTDLLKKKKKRIRCSPEPNSTTLEKAILVVFELNCLHINGKKNITHTAWTINTNVFSLLKNSKWNQPAQLFGTKQVRMVMSNWGCGQNSREEPVTLGKNLGSEINLPLRPPMPKIPHPLCL